MASILKGAPVVAAMNERNAALCEQLKTKGIVPTLAVVRVGAREDDLSYERGVMTRCGKVGVEVKQHLLPADAAQDDLLKVIAEINADDAIHGCLPGVAGVYLMRIIGAIVSFYSEIPIPAIIAGGEGAVVAIRYAAGRTALFHIVVHIHQL